MGKAGENFGPDSKERKMALRALDNDIKFLQRRLVETNMEGYVNIIITSDHGITTRPTGDKQIEIGLVLRKAGLVRIHNDISKGRPTRRSVRRSHTKQ